MRSQLKLKWYLSKWIIVEALNKFPMSLRQTNVFSHLSAYYGIHCCCCCEVPLHFAIVTLWIVIFLILICIMLLWAFYRFCNVHTHTHTRKHRVRTHTPYRSTHNFGIGIVTAALTIHSNERCCDACQRYVRSGWEYTPKALSRLQK